MSKRPTNAKTTKTSSVSSKTSSSSKTTSSSSGTKSVPKSRAASKSPSKSKIEAVSKEKTDTKTESKDVNNNLLSPNKDQKSTDLVKDKQDDAKPVSPTPTDQQTTLNNQVPSKPSELDSELIIDVQPPTPIEDVSEKVKSTKSIKRKPSTQHRNSKQDTAQLLRRKSLTPSAKLSMIINLLNND